MPQKRYLLMGQERAALRRQYAALYAAGIPMMQIASDHGQAFTTVRRLLLEAGAELAPVGATGARDLAARRAAAAKLGRGSAPP